MSTTDAPATAHDLAAQDAARADLMTRLAARDDSTLGTLAKLAQMPPDEARELTDAYREQRERENAIGRAERAALERGPLVLDRRSAARFQPHTAEECSHSALCPHGEPITEQPSAEAPGVPGYLTPRGADDAIEAAWGIIANAGGGNWETQSAEWREAAARWRDDYVGAMWQRRAAAADASAVDAERAAPALADVTIDHQAAHAAHRELIADMTRKGVMDALRHLHQRHRKAAAAGVESFRMDTQAAGLIIDAVPLLVLAVAIAAGSRDAAIFGGALTGLVDADGRELRTAPTILELAASIGPALMVEPPAPAGEASGG